MLRLFLLFFLFQLTACFNSADKLSYEAADNGFVTYESSFDEIWNASQQVFSNSKLTKVSEYKNPKATSYIKAKTGVSLVSYGEFVGVFIRKVSSGYSIRVSSKRKVTGNVFAKNWTNEILTSLKGKLKK